MGDADVQLDFDEEMADDDQLATKKKGRGFADKNEREKIEYEGLTDESGSGVGPARSVEGWILFVTNVHEEAQEEDVYDKFAEYGDIKNMQMNLDRRTGFLKGYALIEFETHKEALAALDALNGSELLGQNIAVSWAFTKSAAQQKRRR